MKNEIVYNVGNPAQLQRLVQKLWEKHHGPGPLMYQGGFTEAVLWLLSAVDSGHVVNLVNPEDHCDCWHEGGACCRCGWDMDYHGLRCEGTASCAHE